MVVEPYVTVKGEVILITPPKACDRLIFYYLIQHQSIPNFRELALSLITYRYPIGNTILSDEDYTRIFELTQKFNQELKLPELPTIPLKKEYQEYDCDVEFQSTGDYQSDELADLINSLGAETAIALYFSVDIATIQQVLNRHQQWKFWQDPDNRKEMKNRQEFAMMTPRINQLKRLKQEAKPLEDFDPNLMQ